MTLHHTNPVDVEYIAAILASAWWGEDIWDRLLPDEKQVYLRQADAVLRVLVIREFFP